MACIVDDMTGHDGGTKYANMVLLMLKILLGFYILIFNVDFGLVKGNKQGGYS